MKLTDRNSQHEKKTILQLNGYWKKNLIKSFIKKQPKEEPLHLAIGMNYLPDVKGASDRICKITHRRNIQAIFTTGFYRHLFFFKKCRLFLISLIYIGWSSAAVSCEQKQTLDELMGNVVLKLKSRHLFTGEHFFVISYTDCNQHHQNHVINLFIQCIFN